MLMGHDKNASLSWLTCADAVYPSLLPFLDTDFDNGQERFYTMQWTTDHLGGLWAEQLEHLGAQKPQSDERSQESIVVGGQ